jgi:hypothetical protein
MTPPASIASPPIAAATLEPANMGSGYAGEVVYLYAFDLAYETLRRPIPGLLGQPTAEFVVDSGKRAPRQLLFYRPQVVRLPPIERLGPCGPLRLERAIKILPVGAISITVSVPFHVRGLDELIQYHDLRFSDGAYLYQSLSARFHLADWHRTIDDKLKTLDDLYQLLRAEQNNKVMLILEASMAVLFVIDLAVLVMSLRK